MSHLHQAIYTLLHDDSTLGSLATGGVHDAESVGRRGLTRAALAGSNSVPIQPALYLHWPNAVPFGGGEVGVQAERVYLEVYAYQDTGYAATQAMRARVMALLHRQRVTLEEGWCFIILWRGDVTQQRDEGLGGVSMERSRYEMQVGR